MKLTPYQEILVRLAVGAEIASCKKLLDGENGRPWLYMEQKVNDLETILEIMRKGTISVK